MCVTGLQAVQFPLVLRRCLNTGVCQIGLPRFVPWWCPEGKNSPEFHIASRIAITTQWVLIRTLMGCGWFLALSRGFWVCLSILSMIAKTIARIALMRHYETSQTNTNPPTQNSKLKTQNATFSALNDYFPNPSPIALTTLRFRPPRHPHVLVSSLYPSHNNHLTRLSLHNPRPP